MDYTKKKPVSEEKRRQIFEEQIMMHQANGKRLESQIGFQAVLVTEVKVNHLMHLILTLLTGGLWALLWIYFALARKEIREILQVDDYGMTKVIPAKS
ncbi:MAG: hypothetical protein OXG60_14880 [Chloroflexi bacterium]|nr:hypothetical protein [Chloroflexota bacterium]